MKLMLSAVTFSAAMTRSPSFSRYSSSTRTSMRPARISASASSIVQKPSDVSIQDSPIQMTLDGARSRAQSTPLPNALQFTISPQMSYGMRLAFSTNAYVNFPFAVAARRLRALGYQAIEIMADVPHAWPAGLLKEQKQQIRDALTANALAISNVNAFMMRAIGDHRQPYWHPSWVEPDAHYRQV